jgi:hypothetical protein
MIVGFGILVLCGVGIELGCVGMRWVALGAYLGDCGGSASYLWKKYAPGSGYHKIK